MNANMGSIDLSPSASVGTGHPPVIYAESVKEDNGVIADGQIVAKDADGEIVPHALVEGTAATGTVDGSNKTFTAALGPVLPHSVVVANDNTSAQELVDDGNGNLVGDGTGTINYKTGDLSVTFTTAPASGKTVLIDHKTQPVGVATREVDTSEEDSAPILRHGMAVREVLLRGTAAADAEDIAALESLGIYMQ